MAEQQNAIKEDVKEYYSKTLKSSGDLKTSACKIRDTASQRKKIAAITKLVHEKVKEKYYGCGLVAPDVLEDQYVLDLGCGSGMDCYILANLVGPNGYITGVDMTEEQLNTAEEYIEYHREAFGYEKANTKFVKGYIEDLKAAGIKDETQNLIISNCVVNLSPDKKAVLSEAYRVLKPGGEMYFSDVYCDKKIPDELRKHKVLWGECISGALDWRELHSLADEIGFSTPILFESSEMTIDNEELEKLVDGYKFTSCTYRLFKLDENDGKGSVKVTYKGGIDKQEEEYKFAHNIALNKCCSVNVPVEVANIIMGTRFRPYFDIGNIQQEESEKQLVVDPFAPNILVKSSGGCGASKSACC